MAKFMIKYYHICSEMYMQIVTTNTSSPKYLSIIHIALRNTQTTYYVEQVAARGALRLTGSGFDPGVMFQINVHLISPGGRPARLV